jgi:hypothetical protein
MPILGGSRVEVSCMHLNVSPGAPGPGLQESMPRSVVSAMCKEIWAERILTGDQPLSPGANLKILPVQPIGACMHLSGTWLVEQGYPSQDLCLKSV